MRDRRLIITVPADKFKALADRAKEACRSPEQQAAFLVRCGLERPDQQPEPVE